MHKFNFIDPLSYQCFLFPEKSPHDTVSVESYTYNFYICIYIYIKVRTSATIIVLKMELVKYMQSHMQFSLVYFLCPSALCIGIAIYFQNSINSFRNAVDRKMLSTPTLSPTLYRQISHPTYLQAIPC